jgi:hypothetical protein
MNSQPEETEKELGPDLKTFESQRAKTKELEILQDQAEKAVGEKKAQIHREIRDKAE